MCKTCVKNVFNLLKTWVFYPANSVDKIVAHAGLWKNTDFSTGLYKSYSQAFLGVLCLLSTEFSTLSTPPTIATTLFNKKGTI